VTSIPRRNKKLVRSGAVFPPFSRANSQLFPRNHKPSILTFFELTCFSALPFLFPGTFLRFSHNEKKTRGTIFEHMEPLLSTCIVHVLGPTEVPVKKLADKERESGKPRCLTCNMFLQSFLSIVRPGQPKTGPGNSLPSIWVPWICTETK
jgi:hypothetical protein